MASKLIQVIDVIYRIIRVILHYVLALIYGFKGKKVPPVKDPILLLSATELAKKIREKQLTSVSVVQAYINRIVEVDTFINATVDRRFKDALEEAKEADALVASGRLTTEQLEKEKPLLGVPLSVKLLLKVKGLRITAGCFLFKDRRADEDADSVTLMKKAGAIVLATTNTAECGLAFQTSNNLHGTTCNPYDTSRTSGGSSGGESALLGAAGSVIGLGNDLAGSIRLPCMFTGLFGHKPSRGLVSNLGCFPFPAKANHLFSTGPMCRYAQDLVTTMRVLSAPDEVGFKFGSKVDFKNVKVYYMCSFGENIPLAENVDPEIKNAVKKVASHLELQGSTINEVTIPLFKKSGPIYFHELLSSIPDVSEVISDGTTKLDGITEFFKYLCFQSKFTLSLLVGINIQRIKLAYDPAKADIFKKLAEKLDDKLENLLDNNSVLVTPTVPFPAPYHNESNLLALSTGYTSIFNVLGLPITQCPVGLNKQGLPIGVQVISRRGNDPLTVACALELEKAFRGWIPPSVQS